MVQIKYQKKWLWLTLLAVMLCVTLLATPVAAGGGGPGGTSTTPMAALATATFDFDTGSPAVGAGQNTPLDQSSGGVTAHFGSPSDPAAFSVQNYNTTFFTLSQFSGNYLYQNSIFKTFLDIGFSQQLTSLSLTFATIEYHGVGEVDEPTTLKLTAFMDSTGTTPVGSATAKGVFGSDTFPQGTLSFDSGGQPFNLVQLELLVQPRGATVFLVDNVTATVADAWNAWDYDANADGMVDKTEAIAALMDYFSLSISRVQVVQVIMLYFGVGG